MRFALYGLAVINILALILFANTPNPVCQQAFGIACHP
jgi:hypothetical protein